MIRTARNLTLGVVFGVILTYELLWNQATAELARELHQHKHSRW